MSRFDQEYQNLSKPAKAAVNALVDAIFAQETGFSGKIDPRKNPQYVRKWLEIRDSVLANQEKLGDLLSGAASGLADVAAVMPIIKDFDPVPPWIRIARAENKRIVHEYEGDLKNPRISQYIATCTKAADKASWDKMGEDGVEWCACFVNWCLKEAGIKGLGSAWAPSWANWGTPLKGPQIGAVVCFRWSGTQIAHVAFCDEEVGKFFMLGGNQSGHPYGGQVSSVPFPRGAATHYRWPPVPITAPASSSTPLKRGVNRLSFSSNATGIPG